MPITSVTDDGRVTFVPAGAPFIGVSSLFPHPEMTAAKKGGERVLRYIMELGFVNGEDRPTKGYRKPSRY